MATKNADPRDYKREFLIKALRDTLAALKLADVNSDYHASWAVGNAALKTARTWGSERKSTR